MFNKIINSFTRRLISNFNKIGILQLNYKIPNYDLNFKNFDCIVDVGFADGTDIFKNVIDIFFYVVEPNPNYNESVISFLKERKGVHIKEALSDKKSEAPFYLRDKASSLIKGNLKKNSEKIIIKTNTLDNVLDIENSIYNNLILKVDTEGNELNVLKGGKKTLKSQKLKMIILELRLQNIQTYNPSEMISFLDKYGFQWHKILKIGHRKSGPSYLDVLFLRKK